MTPEQRQQSAQQGAQPEACECRKALCKAQTMMARLFAQVQAFRLVTRCEKTEWQRDFDEEVDTLAGYVSAALASPCSCVGPRDHLEAVQLESRLLQRTIDSMAAEEAAQKEVNALYRRERDSLRAELAATNSRAEALAGALEDARGANVVLTYDTSREEGLRGEYMRTVERIDAALSAYRAQKEQGR